MSVFLYTNMNGDYSFIKRSCFTKHHGRGTAILLDDGLRWVSVFVCSKGVCVKMGLQGLVYCLIFFYLVLGM